MKGDQGTQNTPLAVDPAAFDTYQIGLHTGIVPPVQQARPHSSSKLDALYTWQLHWPLLNACILGYAIGSPAFSDIFIDILQGKVQKGVCADVDTINHLFSASPDKTLESLRTFVVDRCTNASFESIDRFDLSELPATFVHAMLLAALRRLTPGTTTIQETGCTYHLYEDTEMCYKKHIPAGDERRARRFDLQREKSHKDSEVTKNIGKNEIRAIEWEQRRPEMRLDTAGVDDVSPAVLNREPPTATNQDSDAVPAYNQGAVAGTHVDVSSASSLYSARSKPASELRTSFETALEYDCRSACPGAVLISRNGSPIHSDS